MDEASGGLFTIQEAAAIWKISRQAVYKRLDNLDNLGFTRLQGGKRFITREGIEVYKQVDNQDVNQTRKPDSENMTTNRAEVDRLTGEVDSLKAQLMEARGEADTLRATVTAQAAHIDSLKQALDREQALHMASLQQRLPAGRGEGIFSRLFGRKGGA